MPGPSPSAGQVQRFQSKDREHARHQVEQDAAGECAEHSPQDGIRRQATEGRSTLWNRTRSRAKFEATAVAEREDSGELLRHGAFALELGNQRVARAAG